MIVHDFTAESTKSYEDAIMLALFAATDFLNDMQDAQVFIKELRHTENGKDYFAMLEVTKDPLAPVYTREEFEEMGEDAEEEKFKTFRRKGFPSMKALVVEHFKKKGQDVPTGIPDFILAPLTAVDIENNAIEKDFLFAAEAMPMPLHSDTVVAGGEVEIPVPQEVPAQEPPEQDPPRQNPKAEAMAAA